jgi:uncharacterized protein (DUF302 family)
MSERILLEAKRLIEENLSYEEVVERLKENFSERGVWEIAVIYSGTK